MHLLHPFTPASEVQRTEPLEVSVGFSLLQGRTVALDYMAFQTNRNQSRFLVPIGLKNEAMLKQRFGEILRYNIKI